MLQILIDFKIHVNWKCFDEETMMKLSAEVAYGLNVPAFIYSSKNPASLHVNLKSHIK